jgi:hypothetical protein
MKNTLPALVPVIAALLFFPSLAEATTNAANFGGGSGVTVLGGGNGTNSAVAIGTGYVGTLAPTNGLIVQGNVAIGTTTPASSSVGFDVYEPIIRFGQSSYPANYPSKGYCPACTYLVLDTYPVDDVANDASIVFRDTGNARAEIGLDGDDNLHLKTVDGTYGSEAFHERIVILGSGSGSLEGNVGIGTPSPNQLLQMYATATAGGQLQITNESTGGGSDDGLLIGYNTSNDVIFNNQAASQEKFYTNNTFAMAITSSQLVGIQTNTPAYTLQVNGSVAGTSAYVNTSDARYKKNIEPLEAGLNEIEQLKPVSFEWNDDAYIHPKDCAVLGREMEFPEVSVPCPEDPAMQGKQIGFVAQDVEKILPSVVVTEPNAEKTKGMKYGELIPVLTKAIQQLNDTIMDQEGAMTRDEAKMQELQAQIDALKATLRDSTQQ